MNIIVVGTSNSVIGREVFIKSLEVNHNVIKFTVGRSPLFYSFFTIIENRTLIESCDLLILDHYINDINFYEPRFGDAYVTHMHNFYLYLSSLNVNILFPINGLRNKSNLYIYNMIIELSNSYSFTLLDLNSLNIPNEDFLDNVHITKQLSYFIGMMLDTELYKFQSSLSGGECKSNPYTSLKIGNIDNVIGERCVLKNSILEIPYTLLKGKVHLNLPENQSLFAISYVQTLDSKYLSGISINGKINALSGYGYYLEMLFEPVYGRVDISHVEGVHTLDALMGREIISGEYKFCGLSELYFYDDSLKMVCTSSTRSKININTDCLLKHWQVISKNNPKKKIKNASIGLIRDIAMTLEETDLVAAYELMKIAYYNRKDGVLIKNKFYQYRNKVGW